MKYMKGCIVKSSNKPELTELYHPAIVWEDTDDSRDAFIGIMLTTKPKWKGHINVELPSENHIIFENEECRDKWPETKRYFTTQTLIKKHDWGPFDVIGKLTESGIKYIDEHLSENKPITFQEHRRRNK